MRAPLGGLAPLLASVAAAVATVLVLHAFTGPSDLETRLQAVEARLETLQAARPSVANGRRAEGLHAPAGPTLAGRESSPPPLSAARAADDDRAGRGPGAGAADVAEAAGTVARAPETGAHDDLRDLVDQAVEKKAAQIRFMNANKKPSMDAFAETLELTEAQRRAAEEEVLRSQREILAIIETPARDGTRFLDEVIDVMAAGLARPGQDAGRGKALLGRLMTEKVPGSEDTYAAAMDAVKTRLRETFQRDWSAQQYASFESWQMDPTEVRGIEGSPWKDIEARVLDRARALGAALPPSERR